jgi:hypothetical protein
MKNRNVLFTTILLTFACFALPQRTQAVSPAPDGGYPGGNTAEGQDALLSLTTGSYNTAVGIFALRSDTTGSFNTALGAGTLLANVGNPSSGDGDENTAVGAGALLSNSTGGGNTANGGFALFYNTTGSSDTATGDRALFSNMTGNSNTANGLNALQANTTGNQNTAAGAAALFSNTAGGQNTAVGDNALANNTTGSGNIALGLGAGGIVTTANNVICIGTVGNNVDNSCFIGNIFNATSSGGTAVLVNSNGRLGTMTSSARFKDEIKPMAEASEALLALRPVTFRYKKAIDPEAKCQFGLVAEDVEKVNRDLVVRDKDGKPYSVRYDQVNAMLLNEFLKEHRKVERLEATVVRQQQGMEALAPQIKEQAAQIQKVNAQIELSGAQTTLAGNNQ